MAAGFEDRAEAELRRGVLQIAVLALLKSRAYGYELAGILSAHGLPTEEGTLYPILRRLSAEGLLEAEWDTTGTRPRKYYVTTDKGRAVLHGLVGEWSRVNGALSQVLTDAIPSDDAADDRPADD